MQKLFNLIKQHLILSITSLVIAVTIIAILIFIITLNSQPATLFFNVIPSDVTISIGQENYPNNTAHTFAPGKYMVTISKEDFQEQNIEVTLERDQTTFLETYLLDDNTTGEGFSHYKSNSKDLASLREYLATHPEDEKLKSFIDGYDKAQTIKQVLPIYYFDAPTKDYYSILFNTTPRQCASIYCIEINSSSENMYRAAIQAIEDKGYNIDDYKIIRSSNRKEQ
ncbi:hypothetical protein IKD98_00120 [Candidatus Saccharibacteria bacterium]|nr:hypothetical protein [Candidatus Saccharibacteria bacterium]